LRLIAKDRRSLILFVASDEDADDVVRLFRTYAYPSGSDRKSLFAFQHFDHVSPDIKQLGSWQLYVPDEEYARMGVDTSVQPAPDAPWTLSTANVLYELCSNYPQQIVVPRVMDDSEHLKAVASYRKWGRLPVLSWCGGARANFVSLWRASQPNSSVTGPSRDSDKKYVLCLKAMRKNSGVDRDLMILDVRSEEAARRNMEHNDGGFEEGYEGCRVEFGNVANIIHVRNAWEAMDRAVAQKCKTNIESWWKDVSASGWYDHIASILECTQKVVEELHDHESSVLIHCSDGWDRTTQVTTLTMLCMDAHYRTVDGFFTLIQKEFCSFGHPWRTRLALGEEPTSSYSPIFFQWLECVYQLMEQFPEAFEFTSHLLLTLGTEVLSNRYGNFLSDTEADNRQIVQRHTLSCWSALAKAHIAAGENRSSIYTRSDAALLPNISQDHKRVWTDYWFQYNPV